MALYLVNPAVDMTLELYVSQRLEEALTIQYERIKDRCVRDVFVRKLEEQLESLLTASIDWDLKEPTTAQLNYAILVSSQVGVPLPVEARTYRFHTAMFLETYAPQARRLHSDAATKPDDGATAARELAMARARGDAPSKAQPTHVSPSEPHSSPLTARQVV